jgi:hypothetical protein
MYVGLAFGSATLLASGNSRPEPWQSFMLGVVAYSPTLLQVRYQRYAFKVVSRFCLGLGLALALSAGFFGYPWDSLLAGANVLFLSSVAALFVLTSRWRARHLDIPCLRCSEGHYPFCSWREPEITAALRTYEREPSSLPVSVASFLFAVESQYFPQDKDAGHPPVPFRDSSSNAGSGPPHRGATPSTRHED